jgi:hypothetical protein
MKFSLENRKSGWTSEQVCLVGIESARANSHASQLVVTKPKRNADLRVKSKGLCIFIMSINLWNWIWTKNKLNPLERTF